MKILAAKRGVGKTTTLIKESAKTGAIIVASSFQEARYVKDKANDLGFNIPDPIPFIDFIVDVYNDLYNRENKKYLIDDLGLCLRLINVDLATVDKNAIDILPYSSNVDNMDSK